MGKQRKSPTIMKPLIDEEAILRFASAASEPGSAPAAKELRKSVRKQSDNSKDPCSDALQKGMRQVSIVLSEDIYKKIASEAACKDRTVEEHLKKHLIKRYGN